MLDLTQKLVASIGPESRVTLLFEGKNPDAECFKNLRGYIDMMEMSLLGSRTSGCEKHPWSTAYASGKCRSCVLTEAKSKKKGLRAV